MELKTKARYFSEENEIVVCTLCPHECRLKPGATGFCRVRENNTGQLITSVYGIVSSEAWDPIEKKPLYHFFPGRPIFSIGSLGCNLHCKFCQNWQISQSSAKSFSYYRRETPDQIVAKALSDDRNIGIAYTYNEPTVWYEFMLDTAKLAREKGLKNVVVSNGYINPEPLRELIQYIDAFSIDLKAFTDRYYRKLLGGKLTPVLDAIKIIHDSGKHIEITNLIVPDENDQIDEIVRMVRWISNELGRDTVLHISRYFPAWKWSSPPTEPETLYMALDIATQMLDWVYLGNIASDRGRDTYCPDCRELLIKRIGYHTEISGLTESGDCVYCGRHILDHVSLK
ncbi:MAG: AmmeMemoRadiSam system radical SAM enzyme [Bacteroidales bacterium]